MKNVFTLMLALFMFAFILPVTAMPLASVNKTEKTLHKEVIIKATFVGVEIFSFAESPSVSPLFCERFNFYNSSGIAITKTFYQRPSQNQVKDNIVLLKTENHKIKSRYSPQKLC
jgi:hypothetical protein